MKTYAGDRPRQVNRLVHALDRFESAPPAEGSDLRGDDGRKVWLVPSRRQLEAGAPIALLLESTESDCTVRALRFLLQGDGWDIPALELWAERHLGI